MKTEKVIAVIVAVFALSLAAPGQTNSPDQSQPPATNAPATNAPVAPPTPLPPDRTVSYTPLTGQDAATNVIAVPEEKPADINLPETPLPEAIQNLAVGAGLNIQFDPSLLVGPDGRALTAPNVSIRWKNLTSMQALRALLDNWNWQLVLDPRTHVGRITKKDLAAKEPLVLDVVSLHYSNPTNIIKEIEGSLSLGSSIQADMRTHQLVVRTTEKELAGAKALIARLDTPTRQVLVEAKIIETSKDISSAHGVDWTGTLQNQHVSFGNGLTQGTALQSRTTEPASSATSGTTSPGGAPIAGSGGSGLTTLTSNITSFTTTVAGNASQGGGFSMNTAHGVSPATAFLNADGVSAVLSFLNTDSDSKTIAFPRTVALDGVPTVLEVVQNVPIFQQTQSAPANGAAVGLATIQPNYDLKVEDVVLSEVGVKLTVTPRIAGPTNVLLDLKPEISAQNPGLVSETLNGQVNQAPSFSRSRITTQASVPSGYTLVLGGMDQDVVNKTATKVPFFGDIPGLGNLFRSNSKDHSSQILLFFVTPTIVGEGDYQPADSTFLKRKPSSPSGVKESAWDSAEPYDWTKPKNQVAPDHQP